MTNRAFIRQISTVFIQRLPIIYSVEMNVLMKSEKWVKQVRTGINKNNIKMTKIIKTTLVIN